MAFVVRHGGAAIPLMGQAAYQYGAYKARDRRASRALQRRMQQKSLQAREDSQIRAIEAQQDRDVEMTTRRTNELEQQARIGRESAEQQFGLREDFAEKKFDMERDRMEFGLEQKKDLYDYEYSERDKRRIQEEDAHLQQINDLEAAGTIAPEEAEQFRRQIELRKAGIQPSQKKQWPEGKGVGQPYELNKVGSGMWVVRKPDGSLSKLFDGRADEAAERKDQDKRVSDRRKALDKIQAEKRKYIADREKEETDGVPRYSPTEITRRAAAIFNDRLFEAQMDLVDARLGTEGPAPGAGLRPKITRAEELGMTGEQPPAAPPPIATGGPGGTVSPETSGEAAFGGGAGGAVPVPARLQRYEALARQGKLTERERILYERLKAMATRGVGAR